MFMEEVRYQITDLSKLEYSLVINALKVWRGDWEEGKHTQIWGYQLDELLTKLGYPEKGWLKDGKKLP
jgi:hypothetical protein